MRSRWRLAKKCTRMGISAEAIKDSLSRCASTVSSECVSYESMNVNCLMRLCFMLYDLIFPRWASAAAVRRASGNYQGPYSISINIQRLLE